MVTIAELHLRLDPRDDADLRWFWGDAEGELGLRAQSYEPKITDSLIDPDSDTGDPLVAPRAAAAARYERIAKTLARMPQRLVRVLHRWCGCDGVKTPTVRHGFRPEPWTDRALDQWALLADRTEASRTSHVPLETVCNRLQNGTAEEKADAHFLVTMVCAQAQALLAEAVREYGQCRPRRRAA